MQQQTIDTLIRETSLVGIESLRNISELFNKVKELNGEIAEVGVYKGGSALL